jgi:hypothetical protein
MRWGIPETAERANLTLPALRTEFDKVKSPLFFVMAGLDPAIS